MKKVWTYFAIGCVVAIIGMFFSDICGDFFNGMDYGSGHFCCLIRVCGSLYVWYVFLNIVAGRGKAGSGEFSVLKVSLT
jgi:hypothetical protein